SDWRPPPGITRPESLLRRRTHRPHVRKPRATEFRVSHATLLFAPTEAFSLMVLRLDERVKFYCDGAAGWSQGASLQRGEAKRSLPSPVTLGESAVQLSHQRIHAQCDETVREHWRLD